MFEISPVLAGKFDDPAYAPAAANFGTGHAPAPSSAFADALDAAGGATPVEATSNIQTAQNIDPRRYTQWDRTASQVQDDPNFGFGDFLDLINPLQHIPVISSVYREITGDKISPVSRVAGDILYGGALGAASAVMGGLSAVGDAVTETETGKDVTGVAVAMLFGKDQPGDKTGETQLASAQTSDPAALAATTAANAAANAAVVPAPAASPSPAPANPNVALASAQDGKSLVLPQQKAYALDPARKQPFGGVIDMGKNVEAQNMAIALSEGSHAMRLGNTVYTSPLMAGTGHGAPVASAKAATSNVAANTGANAGNAALATAAAAPALAASAPTSAPTSASSSSSPSAAESLLAARSPAEAQAILSAASPAAPASGNISGTASGDAAQLGPRRNPIPQNLVDDVVMMQALKQYKGVASGPAAIGANLDVAN